MIPNQYPTLNFDLGETAEMLRDSVHSFSTTTLRRAPKRSIAAMNFRAICGR